MIKRKHPIVVLLLLIGLWLLAEALGVNINDTPSMPRGIYIHQHGEIKRGDTVSFCLSESYKTTGVNNLYVEKGRACSGAVVLVKQVIAVPGDLVVLNDNFIQVNNAAPYQYKTKHLDSIGRILTVYPRGTYKNIDGYWVIGTNDQNSWDSRYFGEIKKEQIITKLRPIVTW